MMYLQMHITGQVSPVALLLVLGCIEISDLHRQLGCLLVIPEFSDVFGGH